MKRNSRSNRLSLEAYSLFYGIGSFLSVLACKRYAFFAITGGRLVGFLAVYITVAPLLWLLTVRRERNMVSLLSCSALPGLLYEMLTLSALKNVRLLLLCTGAAALIGGTVHAVIRVLCAGGSRKAFRDKAQRTAVAFWAVTLLPCVPMAHAEGIQAYGGPGREIMGEVEAAAQKPADDPVLTAEELADALAPLASGWKNCTLSEKEALLETLLCAECESLGIEKVPALRITPLPKEPEVILGHYDSDRGMICISQEAVETRSGYETAKILLHEIRHCYQRALTEALSVVSAQQPDLAGLRLWEEAQVYREEFAGYVIPDGSEASLEAYSAQQVEQDAEAYAADRIQYYRALIGQE